MVKVKGRKESKGNDKAGQKKARKGKMWECKKTMQGKAWEGKARKDNFIKACQKNKNNRNCNLKVSKAQLKS